MSNFTMPTNITNIINVWQYANTVTNDLYGFALLLGIFFVAFAGSKQFQTEKAFTVALFITVLVGYLLSSIGLISGGILILPTILLAFVILLL